jgi:hypothetical protein
MGPVPPFQQDQKTAQGGIEFGGKPHRDHGFSMAGVPGGWVIPENVTPLSFGIINSNTIY